MTRKNHGATLPITRAIRELRAIVDPLIHTLEDLDPFLDYERDDAIRQAAAAIASKDDLKARLEGADTEIRRLRAELVTTRMLIPKKRP